jgi:hypothetical protein
MFGRTWNHDSLRKYIIVFGTVFNDIYINRLSNSGEVLQTLKVPLTYGPKDKVLARLEQNPKMDNQVGIVLPRISFEMTTLEYDSTRKLNTLNKLTKQASVAANPDVDDEVKYQYQPVPYDMQFEMNILVKNAEDGTRIVEQIVPYFTPDFTVSVNLVPEVDRARDIPIILNSITSQDEYEGSFEQRRALIWTLNFTMKGYLYGPTKKSKLIKYAETTFRLPEDVDTGNTNNTANTIVVTSRPGLTNQGQPTSNAAASVPYDEIISTDNYGFINTITENI